MKKNWTAVHLGKAKCKIKYCSNEYVTFLIKVAGIGSASPGQILPREGLFRGVWSTSILLPCATLCLFQASTFAYGFWIFSNSCWMFILCSAGPLLLVAWRSMCRPGPTHLKCSSLSACMLDGAYTHISAKIFRDGSTGILGALSSIMWWEQDGMVIYSPSSLNQVATTPIVMNIYSSKIWLHWTWKTHLTSLSRGSKHGIHYTFLWASWKLNIQSNHGKFWSELCIHFSPTKHFQLMWNSIFTVLIHDKNKNKKI